MRGFHGIQNEPALHILKKETIILAVSFYVDDLCLLAMMNSNEKSKLDLL